MKNKLYRYDMTIYYRLFLVYLFASIVYLLLRIQFVGIQFEKIIRDPITILFLVVIAYVIFSTLYNLLMNREILIQNGQITFSSRFKKRFVELNNINGLIITRGSKFQLSKLSRVVRIKLKNEPGTIVFRPYDYENSEELLSDLLEIQTLIERKE